LGKIYYKRFDKNKRFTLPRKISTQAIQYQYPFTQITLAKLPLKPREPENKFKFKYQLLT